MSRGTPRPTKPVTNHEELDALIRRGKTLAAALRSPGARFAGPGEKDMIATCLEQFADVAERAKNAGRLAEAA